MFDDDHADIRNFHLRENPAPKPITCPWILDLDCMSLKAYEETKTRIRQVCACAECRQLREKT